MCSDFCAPKLILCCCFLFCFVICQNAAMFPVDDPTSPPLIGPSTIVVVNDARHQLQPEFLQRTTPYFFDVDPITNQYKWAKVRPGSNPIIFFVCIWVVFLVLQTVRRRRRLVFLACFVFSCVYRYVGFFKRRRMDGGGEEINSNVFFLLRSKLFYLLQIRYTSPEEVVSGHTQGCDLDGGSITRV